MTRFVVAGSTWQATLTITSCVVFGNSLTKYNEKRSCIGGGIGSCYSRVTMIDSDVISNTVEVPAWDYVLMGGGIGITGGEWTTKNCRIAFNKVNGHLRSYNYGGGMYVDGGKHVFANLLIHSNECRDVGSQEIKAFDGDGAYILATTNVIFQNCTFVDNHGQGLSSESNIIVNSSIFWGNGDDITGNVTVTYSNIEDGYAGVGNDYHIQSESGHWTDGDVYVKDDENSPCLDTGDLDADFSFEPKYSGHRVNMGAYGNSIQASKTRQPGTIIVIR